MVEPSKSSSVKTWSWFWPPLVVAVLVGWLSLLRPYTPSVWVRSWPLSSKIWGCCWEEEEDGEGVVIVEMGMLVSEVRIRGVDAVLVATLPLRVKIEPGGMVVVTGEGE